MSPLHADLLSSLRSHKRFLITAVTAAVLLGTTALALVTRGRSGSALVLAGAGLSATVTAAAQRDAADARRGPVQVVRFALHDAGILPREATVAHGRVAVSLTDYTGGAAGLVVEREDGGAVRERAGRVERAGGRWRGKQEMRLRPGTYTLYDESRPEVRATLTVEP